MSKEIFTHVKSGTKYEYILTANVESDLTKVAVYRSLATGFYWTRPYDEFFDGRFVRLE